MDVLDLDATKIGATRSAVKTLDEALLALRRNDYGDTTRGCGIEARMAGVRTFAAGFAESGLRWGRGAGEF